MVPLTRLRWKPRCHYSRCATNKNTIRPAPPMNDPSPIKTSRKPLSRTDRARSRCQNRIMRCIVTSSAPDSRSRSLISSAEAPQMMRARTTRASISISRLTEWNLDFRIRELPRARSSRELEIRDERPQALESLEYPMLFRHPLHQRQHCSGLQRHFSCRDCNSHRLRTAHLESRNERSPISQA